MHAMLYVYILMGIWIACIMHVCADVHTYHTIYMHMQRDCVLHVPYKDTATSEFEQAGLSYSYMHAMH